MSHLGRLLCVGLRGAEPGSPLLEADLEVCRRAMVGAVILFDVDVPTLRRLESNGEPDARARAERNVRDPEQLRRLIQHVREVLGPNTFVSVDQEGGRVARLASARGFEEDLAASEFAARPKRERTERARSQARQLAALGFDLNFAPCVDLDLEPDNPIIGRLGRAYGREPQGVIECARTVVEAHLEAGVAACLKHFPGHGSSRGDTHLGAVDVTDSWRREAELQPYRALAGLPGTAVMVAHVVHRGLDPELPASLSPRVVTSLLREDLGFDGVVVTDSIDMLAIAERYPAGEAAVLAVAAGVDLVVDAFNLREGRTHPAMELVEALEAALAKGRIPGGEARIARSVARLDVLRRQIAARD